MGKNLEFLKLYYNDDEFMFKVGTGLKFTGITAFFAIISLTLTYLLLKVDLIFLETNGYPQQSFFSETYFQYIFANFLDLAPWGILFFIVVFLSGYYIAVIMIRPFKLIGKNCEERMSSVTLFYEPDFFSDLKLLTSFTSYFFSKIDEAKLKGKLEKNEIPSDYTKIHKPIWERNFFINYSFLIIIFSLVASIGIFFLNNEVHSQVSFMADKVIRPNPQVKYFFDNQIEVEKIAIYGLLIVHMIVNFIFGLHLYNMIASPSFAIFATLRSFLKGNFHNRVHLIGYYYLRNDCRKINKYLDKIQKELT